MRTAQEMIEFAKKLQEKAITWVIKSGRRKKEQEHEH